LYRILACISDDHAPGLLALAGLICLGANLVAVTLLQRSLAVPARRLFWLLAAGFTAGVGIWSTHFVAMLAYDPGTLVSYEVGWTSGSLAIAVLLAIPAAAIARTGRSGLRSALAGLVFGLAIAGTHNLGMLGVVIPGTFVWDVPAVILSDVLGAAFSALAFEALRRDLFGAGRAAAAALFFIAIFVLHFIGIGTAVAVPDPTVVAPPWTMPREGLAAAIAAMMLAVLTLGACAAWLDARMSAAAAEIARMRELADAALEGIAILRGPTITEANRSLAALVGRAPQDLVGQPFAGLLAPGEDPPGEGRSAPSVARARLLRADGTALPVEMHLQPMAFADGPRQVVAVRDLRERAAAEAHIRFLAHHDPLTGLLNRASLHERLERAVVAAKEGGRPFALLCLDLDRFKDVNDTFGHPVGDELLRIVAGRLRSLLRSEDGVYRQGGDEFVVVQTGVADLAGVEALGRRIVEALSAPYAAAGRHLTIGASVGVSLYPRDGTDPVQLLKNADIALYKAKGEGRGRVALFDPSLDAALRERRRLEEELRHALARGEFTLVYQPQVAIESGRVAGYEALLRWRSPVLGDRPPSCFIPVAEETGLVLPLGAWALRQACREAASWTAGCTVAVNLSPVQLQDADLPVLVQEVLAETGLEPSRLELEITETALIRDRDRALTGLERLKTLGVRLALDDFGTGYSSLSYLQTFPFDTLKIDRCFVARVAEDASSATIVESVIRLGQGLGLRVVAEGVEHENQLAALRAHGCDAVQGYLLGAPGVVAADRAVPRRSAA
jgi:diguanylate cyclase (GGDEF)-like protein